MLRAIDLCAGAGGLSLGLRRAGWGGVGVEQDPDAVATHLANVGPCDEADVREWSPRGGADLVCGGVPCQPFSDAGKRQGREDPRGLLYRHLFRIADEASTRVWLLENVRGLKRLGLAHLRQEAAALGWHTSWAILDAADYGVPQHRRRLFVLGTRGPLPGFQWPAPTHGPLGLFGLLPWVTVRQALGLPYDSPSPTVTASEDHSGHSDHLTLRQYRHAGERIGHALDEPSPCISAGGTGGGGGPEPIANKEQRARLLSALARLDQPSPTVTAREGKDGARGAHGGTARGRGAGYVLGPALADVIAAGLLDRPATTIDTTNGISPAQNHERSRQAVRLTVAQCAILQGFPPDLRFCGNLTSQHRQVGNAVPPALAEAVARAVRRALEG